MKFAPRLHPERSFPREKKVPGGSSGSYGGPGREVSTSSPARLGRPALHAATHLEFSSGISKQAHRRHEPVREEDQASRPWLLVLRARPLTRASPCRKCALSPASISTSDQDRRCLNRRSLTCTRRDSKPISGSPRPRDGTPVTNIRRWSRLSRSTAHGRRGPRPHQQIKRRAETRCRNRFTRSLKRLDINRTCRSHRYLVVAVIATYRRAAFGSGRSTTVPLPYGSATTSDGRQDPSSVGLSG